MRRWAPLLLVLLLGLLAATFALRTPGPRPASAPPGAFSAARALVDVRQIAQKPHPIGSDEQARVQAYLLVRLAQLGLNPEAHPFASPKGAGQNLIGVLPGQDRAAPALLLMAHADSVAAGPGAADDGAGVAAVLETVRALSTAPRRRDVMVLLTDGEELGLHGAHAFFSADPMHEHVGAAINLEALGNRGRAVMFETHTGAAPMIAALIKAKALTSASSLMPDLYRRLPNGTDLTEALNARIMGLNFAFIGGHDAYHRPTDTPANLHQGSLQHMGDQVLSVASALATAPALPGRAPDHVYADVLGGPVLQYPAPLGWLLIVSAVGTIALRILTLARSGQASPSAIAIGAGAFLLLLVALGAALHGLGTARIALAGHHLAPLLRNAFEMRLGLAALVLGLALVWRALTARLDSSTLALGALTIVAAGAIALQILAPLDAFVFAWPLILIVLAMRLPKPASALLLIATLGQVLYWALMLFDLIGQTLPAALTPFAGLVVATLLPVCPHGDKRLIPGGLAIAALGVLLSVFALYA